MIVGIGIDSVEIKRFALWHTYPKTRLQRIFSAPEIDYCLSSATKSAHRFAARFAAREAFFKALATAIPGHTLGLLATCKHITVDRSTTGAAALHVNWQALCAQEKLPTIPNFTCFISITHTHQTATVIVLLQQD